MVYVQHDLFGAPSKLTHYFLSTTEVPTTMVRVESLPLRVKERTTIMFNNHKIVIGWDGEKPDNSIVRFMASAARDHVQKEFEK